MKEQIKNNVDILDVSDYIINYAYENKINDLTNLKLQKLVFYIYAHYLVTNKKQPLFEEKIEAWFYGPIFPTLYFEFYRLGDKNIPQMKTTLKKELDSAVINSIEYVLDKYGKKKAWELSEQIQEEDPWNLAFTYDNDFSRNKITDNAIFQYYSKNNI
ncbi:Panacea domain-containing protein ['Camptotheca acuminata' phytoplasma]|uniref:Panacea domain-containing protein n=1 Tax='Camptotheca acuminata' phytoplasma TaxID=3239192 RepID=UPI00351A9703